MKKIFETNKNVVANQNYENKKLMRILERVDLDRQAEEIIQCEKDGWYGIDWDVLWQSREETIDLRLDHRRGIDKERFSSFLNTGKLENLEWMFDDEEITLNGLEMFT